MNLSEKSATMNGRASLVKQDDDCILNRKTMNLNEQWQRGFALLSFIAIGIYVVLYVFQSPYADYPLLFILIVAGLPLLF